MIRPRRSTRLRDGCGRAGGSWSTTPPAALTGTEAKRCLADLAVRRQVSASAPHQAFNALLFLFRHVLHHRNSVICRIRHGPSDSKSIPTVLSRQEVERLLAALHEPYA